MSGEKPQVIITEGMVTAALKALESHLWEDGTLGQAGSRTAMREALHAAFQAMPEGAPPTAKSDG